MTSIPGRLSDGMNSTYVSPRVLEDHPPLARNSINESNGCAAISVVEEIRTDLIEVVVAISLATWLLRSIINVFATDAFFLYL
jgi:hypothetical protein